MDLASPSAEARRADSSLVKPADKERSGAASKIDVLPCETELHGLDGKKNLPSGGEDSLSDTDAESETAIEAKRIRVEKEHEARTKRRKVDSGNYKLERQSPQVSQLNPIQPSSCAAPQQAVPPAKAGEPAICKTIDANPSEKPSAYPHLPSLKPKDTKLNVR